MTSPLTGNFDLCVELTDSALSGFAAPLFNGLRKTFPLPSGLGFGGSATLNIQTATLAAAPSSAQPRGAKVSINFVDSSLAVTSNAQPPKQAYAQPLQGTITVTGVPFRFVPTGGQTKTLELDFTASSVNIDPTNGIHWDGNSLDSVENALAQVLPVKPAASVIQQVFAQGLTGALKQNVGAVPISSAVFHMVPQGQDGNLGNPPTFAGVDDTTRAAATPQPGALCILGTIFNKDLAGNSISAKTATATDASHTGSLTISQNGFQNIFNATARAQASGQLPAGTTITSITTTLEQNQIGLQVAGSTIGPFFTATWTIGGVMLASISNGALVLTLIDPVPHVSVSIDWWVWLGSAVLLGPIAAALEVVQGKILDGALAAVQNMIPTLTKDIDQATTAISGIPLTFDKVDVQPDGIILQGMVQLPSTFGTVVQGIVTDPNEVPIPNATVTINPAGEHQGYIASATTHNNGFYKFDTFPLNVFTSDPNATKPNPIYPVVAKQADFLPSNPSKTVTITWGQITIMDFVLQKVLDITVMGKILANGAPVPNATINLAYGEPPDQLTGQIQGSISPKTGAYIITTNPHQYTGGYTVSVSAPGFNLVVRPIGTISNGATVEQDFNLAAPHPFTVMGQITGVMDLGPTIVSVGDATISVVPTTQPSPPLPAYAGNTDTHGNYSINVNPGAYTGEYTVVVEAKGLDGQKQSVPQPSGPSVEADFQLWQTSPKGPKPPGGVKPGTMM
jgi:hypothetical protein